MFSYRCPHCGASAHSSANTSLVGPCPGCGEELGPPPRVRSNPERVAVRRLEVALVEQARLGDAYGRAVGTSAEQSTYARLQEASLEVSRCDRAAKALAL